MGFRPVITIDVDDSKFKAFYEKFKEYAADVDDMPEAWKNLGDAMGGAGKEFETTALSGKDALALAAAQATIIAEALQEAIKAQKSFGKETDKSVKGMDSMAKSAQGVGKAISMVAGGIVKMAAAFGLGALFGGLGIGELTNAAFNRSRQAGSLGVSPGLLASFQVNAQQFLTTSALENAANAQSNIGSAGYMAMLGIGWNRAQRMNSGDLAFAELEKAAEAYRKAPKGLGMAMPAVQAYLAMGGSLGDVRNAALHPGALYAAHRATMAGAGALGFDAQTEAAWNRLKITLDRAGMSIESALIRGLAPLAPQIADLATDVSKVITTFIGGGGFNQVVDDAKIGLHGLADFLQRVDWKKLEGDFEWVLGMFGLIKPKGDDGATPLTPGQKAWSDWKDGDPNSMARALFLGGPNLQDSPYKANGKPLNFRQLESVWMKAGGSAALAPTMAAIALAESSGNPSAANRTDNGGKQTSWGLWQISDGTHNPFSNWDDPVTNARAAVEKIKSQGLRAWGTYDDRHGHHAYLKFLQAEAHARRPARQHAKPPVHVSVTNSTSARVAVSVRAAVS